MDTAEFDPQEVARIIAQALQDKTILPLSFIETSVYDRLHSLLVQYLPYADATWVLSELKSEFLNGFTTMNSAELHQIIHHCTKCESVERPPVQPMWNTVDPDLMLIAENPSSITKYLPDFVALLKTAEFSSQRCMLTYITRCHTKEITPTIIKNCLPYLHTEIAVINPKLIITLGLGAYVALTNDTTSQMKDVRGSIFHFGPYAVLPETSLAGGFYSQEKNLSTHNYMIGSLNTAKTYLYGGNTKNASQGG